MLVKFKNWFLANEKNFLKDNIRVLEYSEKLNDNATSTITVVHETELCIGQISMVSSGNCTIEIINKKDAQMIFHIYGMFKHGIDFDSLLSNYMSYLTNISID